MLNNVKTYCVICNSRIIQTFNHRKLRKRNDTQRIELQSGVGGIVNDTTSRAWHEPTPTVNFSKKL